jgi:putative ABC transport system permease protein
MKLRHSISISVTGLKANKMRSALTALGIIIGIAAVIAMMSIGEGAQDLILGKIQGLGSNLISIIPGKSSENERPVFELSITTLKESDVEALKKKNNVPSAEEVMPGVAGQAIISYLGHDKKVTFSGTTANLPEVNNIQPIIGRFFTKEENTSMSRVVVIGYDIKNEFFGEGDILNETIKINKRNFKVVGVMEEKGRFGGTNIDEMIYLPVTTAQKQILGINHYHEINIKVSDEKFIDQAIENISSTLRITHNISDPTNDDFTVLSQKQFAEIISTITDILTVFISSIAAISLVVGGIGIMNIMLVSVKERTREIGIRKSFGATKKNILTQFLLEAMFLTIIGGIIGITLGGLLSYISSLIFTKLLGTSWGFFLPINSVLLGVGVSATVGLIFGIYPAKKAANLSPINALRYE